MWLLRRNIMGNLGVSGESRAWGEPYRSLFLSPLCSFGAGGREKGRMNLGVLPEIWQAVNCADFSALDWRQCNQMKDRRNRLTERGGTR